MKRLFCALCALLVLAAFASQGRAQQARPTRKPAVSPDTAITSDLRAGKITEGQAALYSAQLLFKKRDLPERYRGIESNLPKIGATTRLLRIMKNWDKLPEEGRKAIPKYLRPDVSRDKMLVRKGTLPLRAALPVGAVGEIVHPDDPAAPPYEYTYSTENFLIHYSLTGTHRLMQAYDNNSNGIPDMVESAGSFLETTATWLSDRSWLLPPDFDTYYYNVYFEKGTYWLGYCYAIDYYSSRVSRSFLVLTSDFSGRHLPNGTPIAPVESMRTTASHEFLHACQFAYDCWEDAWWMEATAVWVQDQIGPEWDAVNDYVWWVADFLLWPENTLDDTDPWSYQWYRDCLWAIFLQTHLDPDGSIIREIWEECVGGTNAITATQNVLAGYGGFTNAWRDFLVANYKADYPEAAEFPNEYGGLWITADVWSYPTGTVSPSYFLPEGLGSNYIRFYPTGSPGYALNILFAGYMSQNWVGMLVGRSGASYTRIDTASEVPAILGGFTDGYQEAMLIVSPMVAGSSSTYYYNFAASLTLGDGAPPTPNPMSFSSAPNATGSTTISMQAALATDAVSPPVEYYIDETTDNPGASGTSWQSSRDHTDTDLAVNTRYGYRVRARDAAPMPNATSWSAVVYAYTLANTPAAPTLHNPAPTKLYISIGASDGNPPATTYAVYNQTAGSYVGADGRPSASAYWATASAWDSIRMLDLSTSTTYTVAVKARNGDGVLTAFSPSDSLTTLAADTQPPDASNIAVVPTWIKEYLTTSATVTATGSDLGRGGSDIVQAECFVGADPGEGSAAAMQSTDGAFNSPVEGVSCSISTSGWLIADNPYNLYVRVRDETGRWSSPTLHSIDVVDGIAPAAVSDLAAQAAAPGIEEPVALTVDSVSSQYPGNEATKAVDGNTSTKWVSEPSAAAGAESLDLDLDGEKAVAKVTLHPSDRVDLFPPDFSIKLSDGVEWWTVVKEVGYTGAAGPNTWQFGTRSASRLRIEIDTTPLDTVSGLYRTELAEVELISDASGTRAVDLAWSAPSDVGPTARSDEYLVKWSNDAAALAAAFTGTVPDDTPPVPGAAGSPQSMAITRLDPGTTYHLALKSTDAYDNWSGISNIATVATLPDPNPYVALDSPRDGCDLDIPTPPTFAWHANIYDLFKVQFSNVPSFPARPYKDALGRRAKTVKFGVKRGLTSFTPKKGQWKALKKIASGMDGTLYWRIEARSRQNKALGVGYSEVFVEYGFNSGIYLSMQFGPHHETGGIPAIWPNIRPQFVWSVSNPIYSRFYVDFAATPDINIYDRKSVYTIRSKNASRGWLRPKPGQYKQIKRRFGNVNGGLIYWRVRGFDSDNVFSCASEAMPLLFDSPAFTLRHPTPHDDGSVPPGQGFTLEWTVTGEGYNRFRAQISLHDTFPKGRETMNLRKVKNRFSIIVTKGQAARLAKMLGNAGTDTFYWRVIATDLDNTITVESPSQEVIISEDPITPGA